MLELAATEMTAVVNPRVAGTAQPRHIKRPLVVGVVGLGERLFAAFFAPRATAHLAELDGVLECLAGEVRASVPPPVLRLTAAERCTRLPFEAGIRAKPAPPIIGRERGRTAATGSCEQPQYRAFARTRDLRFCGFYDRIELAKSFVFITITYIIRTKHLRSRKLGWALDQRLQRNSRLLANQQRVGQIGFRLPVADPRNPRLAALYAKRELGLRLARLGEIRRQVGIRAPEPSCHVSWSVMQVLQTCQYPKPAFYEIPATRYRPYV